MKIHTINSRNAEDQINHALTPKGALLFGSNFNAGAILKGKRGFLHFEAYIADGLLFLLD